MHDMRPNKGYTRLILVKIKQTEELTMLKKCALALASVILIFSFPLFAQPSCNLPFELTTAGSKINDSCGNQIKLKSVNWYGAHMNGVVGGLDKQPLNTIVNLIKTRGFNSVRLVFSNAMLHNNTPVDDKYLTANPELKGKNPLELFDVTIKALTDAGIIVILNNHTTTSVWCCGFDENGLWYNPNQTESQWINDWQTLATRYLSNPLVAGFDLRNEVRPECNGPDCNTLSWDTIKTIQPSWGNGDQSDWKRAATAAGNAIHAINPKALIVVEGINWQGVPYPNPFHTLLPSALWNRIMLMPIEKNPITLNQPNKLVYEAHVYGFTGPNQIGGDVTKGQKSYGDLALEPATLRSVYDQEFGYVAQNQIAPVWIGEVGIAANASDQDKAWFQQTVDYLTANNIGFAYWAINASDPNRGVESYSPLNQDWSGYSQDWRTPYLDRLLGN